MDEERTDVQTVARAAERRTAADPRTSARRTAERRTAERRMVAAHVAELRTAEVRTNLAPQPEVRTAEFRTAEVRTNLAPQPEVRTAEFRTNLARAAEARTAETAEVRTNLAGVGAPWDLGAPGAKRVLRGPCRRRGGRGARSPWPGPLGASSQAETARWRSAWCARCERRRRMMSSPRA